MRCAFVIARAGWDGGCKKVFDAVAFLREAVRAIG
jgi:hypothetical protein